MAYDLQSTSSIFSDTFAAVAQELLVVAVFFISLALWKYVGRRNKSERQKLGKEQWSSTNSRVSPPSTPPWKGHRADKSDSGAEVHGTRQSSITLESHAMQAVQSAEAQMAKLLEQREFTRALNLFRRFERDGRDRHFSEALIASFIQSAIRVGKIDVVERLAQSMKSRKSEPSREFWRTTLKMLSSRKYFEACLSIYNFYGNTLPADKVVFSCLINAALENGAPEIASAMLSRYQEAGLEPKDHVLLFRTFVATSDVDSAEKVFLSMGEDITSLMLNLLLLTCVNAKQPERALEFLQKARAFQEARDCKIANGDTSQEVELIVDVVSYNTAIKGFAQAGKLSRCFDCLHDMRSHNLEPDDVTFGTLLDMCITDGDVGAANEVVSFLISGERPVDTVMCTLFIKGLVRAGKLPKALELYEEMKRRNFAGAKPDIVTYSVLIKAFVDAHDLERALLLVEDLTAAGHAPDDIILTHLLEGCRYVGNHALGKRLFEDMMAAGVKPSDFTLITMVKLHGRCGAHDEAYNLVSTWEKKHGLKPSVIHYTCLMSGCLRTRNYDQAWQAYKLMTETNVQPDETTLATLMPGMVAAQSWERVLTLAKRALKGPSRIPIAAETLNSALTQLRSAPGQSLLADSLEALMREANVRIVAKNAKRPS